MQPDEQSLGFTATRAFRRGARLTMLGAALGFGLAILQAGPANEATVRGADAPPPAPPDPSQATLVADVEWIQPGRPFRAGILFRMQDRWHIYWINPGDSGMPPQITWDLPEGFSAKAAQWPHPRRFDDPPFATFGHEGELLLACEILAPTGLETGKAVTLAADLDWLVCKDICIAQRGRVSIQLDVRNEAPAPSPAARTLFEHADARVPVAVPAWRFAVAADADNYLLSVTPPAGIDIGIVTAAEFFPAQPGFLRSGPYRWREGGAVAHLPLVREGPAPPGNRLHGVLVLPAPAAGKPGLPRAVIVDAALPAGAVRTP